MPGETSNPSSKELSTQAFKATKHRTRINKTQKLFCSNSTIGWHTHKPKHKLPPLFAEDENCFCAAVFGLAVWVTHMVYDVVLVITTSLLRSTPAAVAYCSCWIRLLLHSATGYTHTHMHTYKQNYIQPCTYCIIIIYYCAVEQCMTSAAVMLLHSAVQ